VIQEIRNDNPVLDVVNVPEVFQKQGYTPDVVARRIKDQIRDVDAKEKVIVGQRLIQLATDSPLPDLQIPTANVSLKTTILFVRQLLRFSPDRITVDVMVDYPTADKESTADKTKGVDSRKAQLRVIVRRVPGGGYSSAAEPFSTLDPEDVVRPIAQDVMDEADPYVLGVYILDNSGPKDSESHFIKATELDPRDARAFLAWGYALESEGKLDDAIAKFRKVIHLDPNNAAAYDNWGTVLARQGRRDEAIARYQKSIDLDPKYADAYYNWGNALYNQGKLDEAMAKYHKAIDLDPNNAAAYNNLGTVLARQGKRDEAIAKYRKATELDPKHASAYNGWGDALADQGKRDEAIIKYQKAIDIDPKNTAAYNNWGLALYAEGERDEAIAKFRKAAELEPQNELFRSNLEEALRAKRPSK